MEYEVRYYFSTDKLKKIISKLEKKEDLEKQKRCYEKTMQYDNPNPQFSFYCKEIDGRFRVRVTKNDSISKCKISWKRRIASTIATDVNKEQEIELNIQYNEYDNLMFILDKVLKMKSIESYERYRTIFTNDDVEIAVDEYPFGIALEIENKSKEKDPETVVKYWTDMLELKINDAYRLSWDDKYSELCKQQSIQHYNHVTFDLPMPKVTD